ncbi:MAG: hypothetical protein EOR86_23165 [Mesorhizobium sp.]|uniref:hypothetical protein n=1 Tax=Mesorhizobium sp. TaxID=1871066 RepID=UPI000FE83857|nr:hypothetical protein [Mesorhizobium sp.]RWM91994.1 MAG: hypothetical protein EOR86_23165 [Mesorhizobium sp.]
MAVVPMRKKGRAAESTAIVKPYEPTAQEVTAKATYTKRRETRTPAPGMKVVSTRKGEVLDVSISVDHPDPGLGYELISAAIASECGDFTRGTLETLSMAAQKGDTVHEVSMNYALSMVYGMHPKDQLEATLGVQMAAVHIATMKAAACLGAAKTTQAMEAHERMFNRLSRTFAAQMEALKRYRSKGEQRVYVERVNVEKGGQAIVGNLGHRGGGQDENGR